MKIALTRAEDSADAVRRGETFTASMEVRDDTRKALFESVSSALRFPTYFGYNWDALDECMGDLEWNEESNVIINWHNGLEWGMRNPKHFAMFMSVVADALGVLESEGKRLTLQID